MTVYPTWSRVREGESRDQKNSSGLRATLEKGGLRRSGFKNVSVFIIYSFKVLFRPEFPRNATVLFFPGYKSVFAI